MRYSKRKLAVCTAAVMAVSMTSGMAAMATSASAFSIDMTNSTDEMWNGLAMTNDDAVSTGVNVRDAADENGNVIASLYRGAAVKVLYRGEEWTEIQSGDVKGFVKNDYLTYGTEAKGLADYYGVDGVEASWNDVYVFENPDANASIIHTAGAGETFRVVEDQGHWIAVQIGADQMAYVSEEDVKRVLLVDEAVPYDGAVSGGSYEEAPQEYVEDTWEEPSYDVPAEEPSYDQTYTDAGSDESYTDTGSDSSYSDDSYVDDSYTDDSYAEDISSDEVYSDDGSYEETYSSAETEVVETVDSAAEYTDSTYADSTYTADTSADTSYTDSTYTEDSYTDSTYTEDTSTEETASSSSASSGDLDLLAALIYCEAGNQSYEGMVAVGAVVMNRVASASFPGTISDVIYQSGQFTPAYSGALSSAMANGVPSTCYDAAAAAMNGENPVGGALYFNTGSGSGMKIGDHQFY